MQLAELVGVWDVDALYSACSYRQLREWQEYLIWSAEGKTGDRVVQADPATLAAALAAATGARIERK